MKRVICGVMVVVWLATIVGGCQKGSTAASTPPQVAVLDNATVEVVSHEVDIANLSATFKTRITWNDGLSEDAILRLGLFENVDGRNGAYIALSDEEKLLWKYTSSIDVATESTYSITEESCDDLLTLTVSEKDGVRSETYGDRHDNTITIEIPTPLVDKMLSKTALNSEESQITEAACAKFRSFYNGSTSLEGNRYGNLVNAMIGSQVLTDAVPVAAFKSGHSDPTQGMPWHKKLCLACKACTAIKCFLFPANPVCAACAGCAAACYVVEFICSIVGWEW
jgi:hypothetical protein